MRPVGKDSSEEHLIPNQFCQQLLLVQHEVRREDFSSQQGAVFDSVGSKLLLHSVASSKSIFVMAMEFCWQLTVKYSLISLRQGRYSARRNQLMLRPYYHSPRGSPINSNVEYNLWAKEHRDFSKWREPTQPTLPKPRSIAELAQGTPCFVSSAQGRTFGYFQVCISRNL